MDEMKEVAALLMNLPNKSGERMALVTELALLIQGNDKQEATPAGQAN